jgi:membrane protein YdbS with pleckstrin-like domain
MKAARSEEPDPVGRHASGARRQLGVDDVDIRAVMTALVFGVGLVSFVLHWATSSALLGANLPWPIHVVAVTVFLLVVFVLVFLAARWGYRLVARWSQESRARKGQSRT